MPDNNEKGFRQDLEALQKKVDAEGAQAICIVVYPHTDENGQEGVTTERMLHVDSNIDERSADILAPIAQYLAVYFGDRAPTRDDVSTLMDILLRRRMQAAGDGEIAEILQRMREDHDCDNCDDKDCPQSTANVN